MMTMLLTWQPHDQHNERMGGLPRVLPRHVKLACDFMEAYPEHAITVSMLVSVSGVSGRSLFAGFERFLDMSPHALSARRASGVGASEFAGCRPATRRHPDRHPLNALILAALWGQSEPIPQGSCGSRTVAAQRAYFHWRGTSYWFFGRQTAGRSLL